MSISLTNISLSFGKQTILNRINHQFEIEKKHCIIGPSGGGKTSLIRILSRLQPPTEGKIENSLAFGFVLQEGGLFNHLKAKTNIAMSGLMKGFPQSELDARIEELCSLCYFDRSLLLKHPHQLSGGQKQRVAIMRALFLNPPLLFMDEAFSALDPILKMDLISEFSELVKKLRKTLIFVSHDLKESSLLADEVIYLTGGEIEFSGTIGVFLKIKQSEEVEKWKNSFLI